MCIRDSLGTAMQAQQDFDGAEKVLAQAESVLLEALGPEHPVTRMAQSNLQDNDRLREDAAARAAMRAEDAEAGGDGAE